MASKERIWDYLLGNETVGIVWLTIPLISPEDEKRFLDDDSQAKVTHLSPILSKLSALINPKSPV